MRRLTVSDFPRLSVGDEMKNDWDMLTSGEVVKRFRIGSCWTVPTLTLDTVFAPPMNFTFGGSDSLLWSRGSSSRGGVKCFSRKQPIFVIPLKPALLPGCEDQIGSLRKDTNQLCIIGRFHVLYSSYPALIRSKGGGAIIKFTGLIYTGRLQFQAEKTWRACSLLIRCIVAMKSSCFCQGRGRSGWVPLHRRLEWNWQWGCSDHLHCGLRVKSTWWCEIILHQAAFFPFLI